MASRNLAAQAAQLQDLMPRLVRRLFGLEPGDPAMELPVAQLRVCAILSDGSRTVSCLARELSISASATTQIADRLESAGFVERVAELRDRRVRRLRLTDRGAKMMRARRQRRVRQAAAVLAELSPTRREAALRALRDLLEASDAAPLKKTVAARSVLELER